MSTPIMVILNAKAGKGHQQALCEEVKALFLAEGTDADVRLAHSSAEVDALVERALAQGVTRIVAGGGDGTVSAIASRLVGSGAALGILPLGTLNHFAKDLGIPATLQDAVRLVAEGYAISVDVGQVNDRIFINNLSLGLYPRIVRHRERQQQRLGRGKWPAFFWAALGAMRQFAFLDVKVQIDGQERRRHTPFVFIGNNAYEMEGFSIGGRTRLDANCVSLYMVQKPTRLGLLAMACRALLHRLRQAREFDAWCAKEILIETTGPMLPVAIDGETMSLPGPLKVRSVPKALQVLAACPSQA